MNNCIVEAYLVEHWEGRILQPYTMWLPLNVKIHALLFHVNLRNVVNNYGVDK
jgi:hypothetical protein